MKIGTCRVNKGTEAASIEPSAAVGLSVYADTTSVDGRPPYLVVYMWKRTA